jgi:hypothetical protein
MKARILSGIGRNMDIENQSPTFQYDPRFPEVVTVKTRIAWK